MGSVDLCCPDSDLTARKKYNLKFLTTYTFLNIYFSAFKGPVRSESNPGSGDPQDSQLFYESEINNKGISREA